MRAQHLRIARATNRLAAIVTFYRHVLAFELVASFEDHAGFDGAMLGHPDEAYHLEFTHERGRDAATAPDPEDLLVLYLEAPAWHAQRARLDALGVPIVAAHNPYWDAHGVTIEDPDGRRIVLHRGPWHTASVSNDIELLRE